MEFKVDYDDLQEIGNNVVKQNEALSVHLGDIVKIISDLDKGWSGPDCENFQTISTTYIKGLEDLLNDIEFMGNTMVKASKSYENNDKGWETSVKKIGEKEYEHK